MKKLLVAGLVMTVAASAWAASPTPGLATHKNQPAAKSLAKTLLKHPVQPAQPVMTGSLNRTAPVKTGTEATPHFASAAETEYYYLKSHGLPIPEALILEVFGAPPQGGARNGGETWATAAPITFSAGGTFTDNGTTVGFANDVPSPQTAPVGCNTSYYTSDFGAGDAIYTFTLPDNYEVSADVCTGTTYDSCLGIFNAAHALVAVNDDGCSLQSEIVPCCLPAGTYFLVVDGYGAASGPYTLSVNFGAAPCGAAGDPCDNPIILACGDTASGNNGDGDNYVGNPAPDIFYQVVIDQSGPVTFSCCDGGTDYDSYLRLYDACPTEGGVELGFNDDSCGLQSELVLALEPGTYWLVVEGYASEVGNFSVNVNCASCDPIACVGDDEGEPNNGPAEFGGDDTYGTIDCGVTICGTTWADGGTRDTDWFELLLLDGSYLSITSEAELFDPLIFVLDESYNILFTANDLGFCEGESLTTDCLLAGTYYVWMGHAGFEGVPDEVAYSMTLACEACVPIDPCEAATAIGCNESVTGDDSMSAGNEWETYCNGGETGPEVVYEFTHNGGFLEITLNSDTAEDLDMTLMGSCDPLDCLDMPYAVGTPETISGVYPAGTYYISVDAWNWAGGSFTFTLDIICGDDPCADLPPVNCVGTQETEPNEGWNDNNASYDEIVCGETVCGSTWATGGNRDLDWYHFTHTGGDLQIDTQIGAFDCILFVTDFTVNGTIYVQQDAEPMCVPETAFVTGLAAGEYFIVIAHNNFEGVDTDQDYALTLTCFGDPCEGHVPIDCQGTAETEPNEGWNDDNASYNEISDGETVCGSVWADGGNRDLDWFHFTVDEVTNVRLVSEIDEFNCILFLTQFAVGGSIVTAADMNGPCTGETILYECLDPGEYYAVIAHNDFEGVPEDQNYALTMNFEACTPTDPCADILIGNWTNGYYTVQRPAPTANHHNAMNGCEGGISSAGYDELHLLTLAAPADIRVTLTGNGMADEVTFILTDCMFTESCVAGVDVGGTDTAPEVLDVADLPAGTYYIVADFWGSAETHPYTLQVRNVSIDVDGQVQPLAFALEQNYPNPFNPVTSISWTQPDLLPASLAVFNLAGEKVQAFNLGFRGAGVHTYSWDASALSSGVYFYTLTTGGQSLTMKAVLIK